MPEKRMRYGDVMSHVTPHQQQISYNQLTPEPQYDEQGREIPYEPPKLLLRKRDIYHLLKPYIQTRLWDQLRAVLPLALYLSLFQFLVLRTHIADANIIGFGLVAVIIGLMLFMEGLKLGLMPFGEYIGDILPRKLHLLSVLGIVFLLGIGVTFAEPAIGALKTAGQSVESQQAPYLYALLNLYSDALVLVVGGGVGLAAIIATLRFIYGWSLKPLIFMTLIPTLGLSAYMSSVPTLQTILGLAWDCGAVTTGPVTVPLVLALGIGVASATGRNNESLSGFGIVTLASLFPILGVLLLGLYISYTVPVTEIIHLATTVTTENIAWYERSPYNEIITGLRAILPLVLFLFIILSIVLKEKINKPWIVVYGITLTVLGMIIFNLGLTYGLSKLGSQSGSLIPMAFMPMENTENTPLFTPFLIGIMVAFIFAWLLGFGATLAEPALHAMGLTVENLTQGAFKKSLLIYAVSFGVAWGISLGIIKLIFNIPLAYFVLVGYSIALLLTFFSTEEFVNIAWDSAGVTTGPITVPLVLAMGLGLGNALNVLDGFGILALASIGPIISVLSTGLWIQWKIRQSYQADLH